MLSSDPKKIRSTGNRVPRRVPFTREAQIEWGILARNATSRRVPFTREAQAEWGILARNAIRRQITKVSSPPNNRKHDRQITHTLWGVHRVSRVSLDSAELAKVVADARPARGNRRELRKPTRPVNRGERDRWKRVQFHLRRLSWRALNDIAKRGAAEPTVDELATALITYVWDELSKLVHEEEPGAGRIGRDRVQFLDGSEAVDRVAYNAARYALRNPGEAARYMAEMQRRGSKGGAKSKRGRDWGEDEIRSLQRLMISRPGLTVKQQAVELRLSLRTTERVRAELRKRELDQKQ